MRGVEGKYWGWGLESGLSESDPYQVVGRQPISSIYMSKAMFERHFDITASRYAYDRKCPNKGSDNLSVQRMRFINFGSEAEGQWFSFCGR